MVSLNFENFPCGCEPETLTVMNKARSCRCGSRNIMPVSDCGYPPVIAIACDDCGAIEGDAPTLAGAVINWNRLGG